MKNVGTVTLPQLLSQKTFGKVYIMLGINELGNDLDDITAKFSALIDTVRAAQPNAIVYVEANLHVGPSRSSTDATFNNPRINRLNEKLAALADGKDIFYIDINEVFDDENGNLRADASGDSTHVYAKYDLDWCDWLCTKAIVRLNKRKGQPKSFRWFCCDRAVTVLSHGLSRRDVCQRLMMYHTNPAQARTIPPPTAAKRSCPPFPWSPAGVRPWQQSDLP